MDKAKRDADDAKRRAGSDRWGVEQEANRAKRDADDAKRQADSDRQGAK